MNVTVLDDSQQTYCVDRRMLVAAWVCVQVLPARQLPWRSLPAQRRTGNTGSAQAYLFSTPPAVHINTSSFLHYQQYVSDSTACVYGPPGG